VSHRHTRRRIVDNLPAEYREAVRGLFRRHEGEEETVLLCSTCGLSVGGLFRRERDVQLVLASGELLGVDRDSRVEIPCTCGACYERRGFDLLRTARRTSPQRLH